MNKEFLKEAVKHGTDEYSFAQYHIRDLMYPYYMPYHWHEEIELIYIKYGTLMVVIDGVEYKAVAGDIYCVNPSEIHMMYTDDLEVDYYTVLYDLSLVSFKDSDNIEEYYDLIKSNKIKIMPNLRKHTLYKKILPLVEKVIKANEIKDELYTLDTRINLLRLMYILASNKSGVDITTYSGKNGEIKRNIISYIENNYTSKITLADAANVVHMSEKYFSRFFKENFGVNFVDYVNRVRLERAASLLLSSDASVTDVALSCGYTNISYFIRRFNKAFGTSPHAFRRG